jgi:hypothetical protein
MTIGILPGGTAPVPTSDLMLVIQWRIPLSRLLPGRFLRRARGFATRRSLGSPALLHRVGQCLPARLS